MNNSKKIRQSVTSVANNINQIAHRVNSTSRIYNQEMFELQSDSERVHQTEFVFCNKNFSGQI